MKPFLKKTPTLIVIGVTGFVAYTVLFPDGDPGPPKTGAKPPTTSKFETSIVADILRNPFLMEHRVESDSRTTALSASDPARGAGEPAKSEKPNELPALPAEDDSVLESMKLVGTFVDSREQLAIIDNKVYSRGDRLRGADGATLPYVVTEVRKDRALIRRGRRDFVIAFSDVPRSAAPRAISPPTPAAEKTLTRADGKTRFNPVEKSKKGQTTATGQPGGNDANDQ